MAEHALHRDCEPSATFYVVALDGLADYSTNRCGFRLPLRLCSCPSWRFDPNCLSDLVRSLGSAAAGPAAELRPRGARPTATRRLSVPHDVRGRLTPATIPWGNRMKNHKDGS